MAVRGLVWFLAIGVASVQPHGAQAQRATGYDTFAVTAAQMRTISSSRFEACKEANQAITPRLGCYGAERDRLMTRVNADYRNATARLTPSRARTLRLDQRTWLDQYEQACFDQFDSQIEVHDCILSEVKRRIFWLRAVR